MINKMKKTYINLILQIFIMIFFAGSASAWFGKTHIAVAKAGGYKNWYNAAAADLAKLKAGDIEQYNHYVNNRRGTVITPEIVLEQAEKYNNPRDRDGHLYGAIISSVRLYIKDKRAGRYPEDHMAYCVHYVGDLSMPLHNILFNDFNKKHHMEMDGIIEKDILNVQSKIKIKKITIKTEEDLAREIAGIGNISMELAFRLEDENRMMTQEEAYRQVSYSASLLGAILEYVGSE